MEQSPSMNIMITNVCPNKCKYCFAPVANKYTEKPIFMSLTDFLSVLNFFKKSNLNNVRLLGGEPLIHPDFKQFIEEVLKEESFEFISVFTSGIFSPELIECLENDRIIVIVNCNHPKDYSPLHYKTLIANLESMVDRGIRVVIGYNIYEQDFDYYPIIELCDDLAVDTLRICIANPNIAKTVEVLDREQREKIGDKIYSLIIECANRNINVIVDCVLTPCIFTDEQWGKITKLYPQIANSYAVCTPVMDVDSNLYVSRCFSLGNNQTVNLNKFNNSKELWDFFSEQIDYYKWYAAEDKCKNCEYYTLGVCQGGCLGFTYPKITTLKEKQCESKNLFTEAYYYLRSHNYNSAIDKFEEGLMTYNYDSTILCDYIFALLKDSQFSKAQSTLNYYDKILNGDNFGSYFMIKGLLAEAIKDKKSAIRFYRKALKKIDKDKKKQIFERLEVLRK